MAETLPEGLISTNDAITGDVGDDDGVEVEDIQKLWKSYSANRAVIAENVGRRLENFFWRIWSNIHILERISGAQVAAQFRAITEGGTIEDRVPTPTQSPRSSKSLGSHYNDFRNDSQKEDVTPSAPPPRLGQDDIEDENRTPTPTSPFTTLTNTRLSSARPAEPIMSSETINQIQEDLDEDDDETPTPSSIFSDISNARSEIKGCGRSQVTRPHPILKKESSSGSGKSSKSTAFVLPPAQQPQSTTAVTNKEAVSSDKNLGVNGQKFDTGSPPERRRTSTRFSEEVAVSTPKASSSVIKATEKVSRSQGGESTQKPGKRNPMVLASTGASRRRPGVLRQRSSHNTHDSFKVKPSPSPPASSEVQRPGSVSTDASDSSNQDLELGSSKQNRTASPHTTSTPRQRSLDTQELVQEARDAKDASTRRNVPLVDSHFRSRFAERGTLSHRPFTHLSSFTSKSGASTAMAASYQASGHLDPGSTASSNKKGKGREAFRDEIIPLKDAAPSSAKLTAEEPSQVLPRTKSQLTLLLERSRLSGQEQTAKENQQHS